MSGAVTAALALGTQSGGGSGGSDVTPDAVNWTDVSGDNIAHTNTQTISGINTTITLTISWTGSATGYYTKNGSGLTLISTGGSFTVVNTDTLKFSMGNSAPSTTKTGVVTVTNTSDSGTVLDTFSYSVTDSIA